MFAPSRRRFVAGLAAAALLPNAAAAGIGRLPPPDEATGRADVPGGTVWWRKVGHGPKPPLLLLHGGPGMGHNYLLPLKALAEERVVVFYDQLGCGQADSPPDESLYTVQRAVDEVDAVRKALGLDRIVLYGHSWGSMLAIEYLCQGRGAGVEQLILAGALASVKQAMEGQQRLIDDLPHGAGKRLHALEAAHQEDSAEYRKLVQLFYDRHVCRKQPMPPEAAQSLDIVAKSIAYRVMNGPNEFTITGVIKDWERRPDLGRIKLPTLITRGEFDEVTVDCQLAIQQGIAGSQLKSFAGCSHLSMNEQPQAYVAALRKFLG